MVRVAKYLGVHITQNINIGDHLRLTGERCKTTYALFGKLSKATWGLRYPMMKLYYGSIFVPTIAYAVGAWGDRVGSRTERQILSIQRFMLLQVNKAYCTVSTEALQVIAGLLPLDIEIRQRKRIYLLKKKGTRVFTHLNLEHCPSRAAAIRLIKQDSLAHWEQRWTNSNLAHITHHFFPSVIARLDMPWIRPGYALTQLLSGHGNFKAKLWIMGLSDTALCRCGEEDTARHAILTCHLLDDLRMDLQREVAQNGLAWPPEWLMGGEGWRYGAWLRGTRRRALAFILSHTLPVPW